MARITVTNVHGTTIELSHITKPTSYFMVVVKTPVGVTSLDVQTFDEAIEVYENCVKGELEAMGMFLRSQYGGDSNGN